MLRKPLTPPARSARASVCGNSFFLSIYGACLYLVDCMRGEDGRPRLSEGPDGLHMRRYSTRYERAAREERPYAQLGVAPGGSLSRSSSEATVVSSDDEAVGEHGLTGAEVRCRHM